MSHVADVDIKFRDLQCAATAAKALGGELILNKKTFEWYGQFLNDWRSDRAAVNRRDPKTFGKCDHVIRFPNTTYEIGLCAEEDGSYTAVYDSYGPQGRTIEQKCGGVGLPKLKDEYAAAVSIRTLARKGFRVTRTTGKQGEIVLKAVS